MRGSPPEEENCWIGAGPGRDPGVGRIAHTFLRMKSTLARLRDGRAQRLYLPLRQALGGGRGREQRERRRKGLKQGNGRLPRDSSHGCAFFCRNPVGVVPTLWSTTLRGFVSVRFKTDAPAGPASARHPGVRTSGPPRARFRRTRAVGRCPPDDARSTARPRRRVHSPLTVTDSSRTPAAPARTRMTPPQIDGARPGRRQLAEATGTLPGPPRSSRRRSPARGGRPTRPARSRSCSPWHGFPPPGPPPPSPATPHGTARPPCAPGRRRIRGRQSATVTVRRDTRPAGHMPIRLPHHAHALGHVRMRQRERSVHLPAAHDRTPGSSRGARKHFLEGAVRPGLPWSRECRTPCRSRGDAYRIAYPCAGSCPPAATGSESPIPTRGSWGSAGRSPGRHRSTADASLLERRGIILGPSARSAWPGPG